MHREAFTNRLIVLLNSVNVEYKMVLNKQPESSSQLEFLQVISKNGNTARKLTDGLHSNMETFLQSIGFNRT